MQTQIRPGVATSQVRLVTPGTAVVRPGQVIQQRLVTPVRAAVQTTRMVTTIRPPNSGSPVIVSSSQPPALHPVYPSNQVRPGVNIRPPVQVGRSPTENNYETLIKKLILGEMLVFCKGAKSSFLQKSAVSDFLTVLFYY